MNVASILATKGRDVATVTADHAVGEAVSELAARRIGALVVTAPGERIAGIISERDIVRAIAQKGPAALDEKVASIMTREVVTCAEEDGIDAVMAKMTIGRFRHLPVVAAGRLRGIVSIGDVVKARIEEVEREAADLRVYIATA